MSRKLTNSEFLEKAKVLHGDTYDYSLVEYGGRTVPVTIGCNKHGNFAQTPNRHLSGNGCNLCGRERSATAKRKKQEDFIEQARSLHGDQFDYSEVVYKNSASKIRIRCKTHDLWFEQVANTHLTFRGCPTCKSETCSHVRVETTAEFVEKARATHGDRYDYSESVYVGYMEKLAIKCHEHGIFWQTALMHHAWGCGCPSCAHGGYSPSKPGTLYVLTCGDITKVGITNLSAQRRAAQIKYTSSFVFDVLREYPGLDGRFCSQAEDDILVFLRAKYSYPSAKFQGYTESFMGVDRAELLSLLDDMVVKA